jgi:Tfp pilus assembly protein PilF
LACAIAGDRERAFPLLRQAAADFPNDTEVLIYLAEAYRNSGDSDRAVPLYRHAMELDPDQVTASVGLGAILMERRQFSDAIPMWEDALAKNAGLVLVRTNLAQAYLKTGQRQIAERQLQRVLELSPAFAPAAKLLTSLRQR